MDWNITSWTDYGMDWTDPDPLDEVYYIALAAAVKERCLFSNPSDRFSSVEGIGARCTAGYVDRALVYMPVRSTMFINQLCYTLSNLCKFFYRNRNHVAYRIGLDDIERNTTGSYSRRIERFGFDFLIGAASAIGTIYPIEDIYVFDAMMRTANKDVVKRRMLKMYNLINRMTFFQAYHAFKGYGKEILDSHGILKQTDVYLHPVLQGIDFYCDLYSISTQYDSMSDVFEPTIPFIRRLHFTKERSYQVVYDNQKIREDGYWNLEFSSEKDGAMFAESLDTFVDMGIEGGFKFRAPSQQSA